MHTSTICIVLNLVITSRGVRPAGQGPQIGLERDLQAVRKEGHEDVRLDAILVAVEDRPHGQIVFEFLEGLLDLGELDIERPQALWLLRIEVGAQQITTFTPAHLAQLGAVEPQRQAGHFLGLFFGLRQKNLWASFGSGSLPST